VLSPLEDRLEPLEGRGAHFAAGLPSASLKVDIKRPASRSHDAAPAGTHRQAANRRIQHPTCPPPRAPPKATSSAGQAMNAACLGCAVQTICSVISDLHHAAMFKDGELTEPTCIDCKGQGFVYVAI
jgi:hypothetical protein